MKVEIAIDYAPDITEIYKENQIISIVRGMQSISGNETLSWGLLGQYGSITIADTDGKIKNLAQAGVLKNGAKIPIRIYLDGTLIGTYIGSKWSYQLGGYKATVSLTSRLQQLENTLYPGYALRENQTNLDFFNDLRAISTARKFPVKQIDTSLENYFGNGKQQYLIMSRCGLRMAWDSFCNAVQIQAYFDENDELVITPYN